MSAIFKTIISILNHERKLDYFFSCTKFRITTTNGRRVKFCSFIKSICHHIPKLSSSNALQLIKQDLVPEFSTLYIRSLAWNKSSTLGIKNLLKWFGEIRKKGIQMSLIRDTCLCLFYLCVDTLHKVGGKMILSLKYCTWNPSSYSILHFHLDLCLSIKPIVHWLHNNVSSLCFIKIHSYNGNNIES